MRYWLIIGILALLAGGALVIHSRSYPFYTYPAARDKLERELSEAPREIQSEQWYRRLHELETPRKEHSDLGRGLIAAGVGLLAAVAFWRSYHRSADMRTFRKVLLAWTGLWLVRVPLTLWYYSLRFSRGDYPWWSDSIAIPIFSESVVWVVGAAISTLLLWLLQKGHALPEVVRLVRPKTSWGWVRAIVLALWMALLANILYEGVRYGSEGEAFTSVLALVILYVLLCSQRVQSSGLREIRAVDGQQ